ncbi:Regulation of nuclear pre-mRNA domain-containing protein 1A [Geranomyces variabilis]|nr:Regulation of nuclear pre-mRNA domain-containing protein 1A [Geranomyces variabilis]
MMSQYNEAALAQKLNRLQDTQDSINTLSQSAPSRKLAYLYLANDVVQSSRRKGEDFVREFAKVFPEALPHAFRHSGPEVQLKIGRILGILEQRKIYTPEFVQSIKDNLGGDGGRGATPPPQQPPPQPRPTRLAAKSNSRSLPEPTSGKRASAAAATKKNIVTPSEDSDSGESAGPTYLSPVDSARTSPTQLHRPLPTQQQSERSQAELEPYLNLDASDYPFAPHSESFDSAAVDQKRATSADQKKPATPKATAAAQKGKKPQASKIVQIVSDNKVTGDVASIAQHLEAIKQLDIAKATQSLVMTAQEDADEQGNNQPIIASLTRYRLTLAEDIAKRTSLIRELQTLQERMLVFVKGDQIALQKCNERIAYLHSRRKSQTVLPLRHTGPKIQHPPPAQQAAVMMDIDQSPVSPQPAATMPSGIIPAAAAAATASPVPQPVTPVTAAAPRRENREYIPYSVGQIVAATPEVYAQEVAKLLNAENNSSNVQVMGVPMPAGAPGRAQLASSISSAIARAKDGVSPVLPVSSPGGAPSPVTPGGVPGPATTGAAAAGAAPPVKAAAGTMKAAVPGGKAASTYIKPATPVAKGAAPSSAKAATSTVKAAAGGTVKATPKPAVGRPSTVGRPTPGVLKTAGGPIRTKVSGPNPAFRPLGRPPTASKPAAGAPATPQTPGWTPTADVGQVGRPPATMQTMQSIAIPADGIMAPGMASAPMRPQSVPIPKTTPAKQQMPPPSMPPGTMASGGPPRAGPSPRVSRPIAPPPGTAGAPPPQAGFKHLSTVPATQLVAVPVHAKYVQQPTVVGRPRLQTTTATANPAMPSPRPIAPRPGPPAPGQPMRSPSIAQQGATPMPIAQPRPVPRPSPALGAGQGGPAGGPTAAPLHPAPPTPTSTTPMNLSTPIARPASAPAVVAPPSTGGAPTPVARPTPVRPPAPSPRP